MDVQLWPVLATALVSVATTLVAVFYGPAWKDRVDARRALQQRSEQLLARYSEPLARAAFDLQSRLYNMCRLGFMTASNIPERYRRLSTLWFYGQFLAWVEIVRRDVQVIDFGDVRRTAALQRRLFDVVDILASDSIPDPTLRIFRADQRAIGELMVTERSTADEHRGDSLGYAQFVQRMNTDAVLAGWFAGLDGDIVALVAGGALGARAVLTQRALIDLIDFLDPEWVRFPDPNERGKLPLPPGVVDPKRARPASRVARFRFETDPLSVLESWAQQRGLPLTRDEPSTARVQLPRRPVVRHAILMISAPPWVELHVVPRTAWSDQAQLAAFPHLSPAEADALNSLLLRFDRPTLAPTTRRRPIQ